MTACMHVPGMDVAAWKQRAANAVVVFRNALAYHPVLAKVITPSGMHNSIAVRRWRFLGTEIPDDKALYRALGLLSPTDVACNLPPVNHIRTVSLDIALQEDMIPGAKLPDLPWPTDFNPCIDTLRAWMRTRHNMPLLSDGRKDDLLKAVKDKLAVEAAARARGEPVLLRDPTGRSLISYIQECNPDEGFHFVEDSSSTHSLPEFGWTYDLQFIQQNAPEASLYLIHQHWEHRMCGAGGSHTRTILDDALSRVREIDRLVTFAYHENGPGRNEPRSVQRGGGQRSVFFKFSAPASYRQGVVYHVWAECSVSDIPGFHPFLSRILRCGCSCPIGTGADCVHLLMLLMIVHLLPRPSGLSISKPCTSMKCAWMNPGGGDTWSATTPVYSIPFIQQHSKKERSRRKKGGAASTGGGPDVHIGGRDSTNCERDSYHPTFDTSGFRANYNPYADKDKPRIRGAVNAPSRVALFKRVLAAAAKANGEPCAWELAYGTRQETAGAP